MNPSKSIENLENAIQIAYNLSKSVKNSIKNLEILEKSIEIHWNPSKNLENI